MVIEKKLLELKESLDTKGYCFLKNSVSRELINYLQISCNVINHTTFSEPSSSDHERSVIDQGTNKNSEAHYCPIFGDSLLMHFLPLYRSISKKVLSPSFCFYRRYYKGNTLNPHTDRPSCQYSITMFLNSSHNKTWDFYLKDKLNNEVKIEQNYGDLILYKGEEVLHWRKPLTSNDFTDHIFLHWVDSQDPIYKPHILDGRPHLGIGAEAEKN